MALDAVDRRIVALLSEDGRMSINELAGRAHVSRATAYARLERLRRDGVITGFAAMVDPAKVGYPIAALVLVRLHDIPGIRRTQTIFILDEARGNHLAPPEPA